MTKEDILRLRDTAEQTRVQFKERVTRDNKYDVSCEMVAQSNSHGGMIVLVTLGTGSCHASEHQAIGQGTETL